MFWQSLQVTFEILCSDVAQIGSCSFLDQTRKINGHFGYISTGISRTKGQFVMFMGHIGVPTKEAHQKVRYDSYFISAFCVVPAGLKYAILSLFTVVLSSDNSFLCFSRKAFLAGFTMSVAFNLGSYMCDLMKV